MCGDHPIERFGDRLNDFDYRPKQHCLQREGTWALVPGELVRGYDDEIVLFHYAFEKHGFINARQYWTTLRSDHNAAIGFWIGYEADFVWRAVWKFNRLNWRDLVIQGNAKMDSRYQQREYLNINPVRPPSLTWELLKSE